LPGDVLVLSGDRKAGFRTLFYQIEALKSGMHHRDGMLWICTPERHGHTYQQKIPLTSVHSMLLHSMKLGEPAGMKGKGQEHLVPERARA
jgi:hypothetical protein